MYRESELTTEQRIAIYKKVLAFLEVRRWYKFHEEDFNTGLCRVFRYIGYNTTQALSELPEIRELKPRRTYHGSGYWWKPGRVEIRYWFMKRVIALAERRKKEEDSQNKEYELRQLNWEKHERSR